MRKYTKLILIFFALSISFIGLAFVTNLSTEVLREDEVVFMSLGFKKSKINLSYADEIDLISRFQAAVFKRAPLGVGIPLFQEREPSDLIEFGQGLCYDRSRTLDKGLKYLGFETRHVFLLHRQNKSFLTAFLSFGQASHAVTEVKTSKGWLLVDSNTPWLSITRSGTPVNADDVWQRFSEFQDPPPYLNEPWWAIRGLYSRKGHFYPPFITFPELNWVDFSNWILFG
jgi:hypothetical protein